MLMTTSALQTSGGLCVIQSLGILTVIQSMKSTYMPCWLLVEGENQHRLVGCAKIVLNMS